MSTTKSSTTRPKAQPKPKLLKESHDDRYGDLRDKLSDEHLKQIVEEICGKNYDEKAAAALVLLVDEVERSQFDTASLQNIAIIVSKAAFRYTEKHSRAIESMVVGMRRELARKELVN